MSGISRANQRQSRVNKPRYDAYVRNETRAKNKAYKIIRFLEKNPNCEDSKKRLEALPSFCAKAARAKLKKERDITNQHLNKGEK